jgi:D-serine deaminase-like pyridoxal phosphate-dependent protein
MNALDENIETINKRAKGRNIRIATKSVRCRVLLQYIEEKLAHDFGFMAFTSEEALWLAQNGFKNILIGYPMMDEKYVDEILSNTAYSQAITFMVDSVSHVEFLNKIALKYEQKVNVCVDIDMSTQFPGIYFGVYRSSMKNAADLSKLFDTCSSFTTINWKGLMGYEAQIAGVGDNVKGQTLMNSIIKFLKKRSIKTIAERRASCLEVFAAKGIQLDFVNGGGTGSIESTLEESGVTEITVGSGFYQSHLFDNYSNFKHKPAAAFGLQIVRQPQKDMFTALGGGYIASGATDKNKTPQAFLPEGMQLIANEGTGEVQTPFIYKGNESLKIGDVVFFRHAKAGELCERFNELILVRDNKIEQSVPTYRGEQKCFL